jgi:hypothetical protein
MFKFQKKRGKKQYSAMNIINACKVPENRRGVEKYMNKKGI